jgi:hypothetical protein
MLCYSNDNFVTVSFQWKRSERSTSGFAFFESPPMHCLAVIVATISFTRRTNEIIMSFCAP